jgi:hypothetical protein
MEQLDLQQSNRPFRDNFRTCAGTLPDGKAARFYCKVLDKYFEIKGVNLRDTEVAISEFF